MTRKKENGVHVKAAKAVSKKSEASKVEKPKKPILKDASEEHYFVLCDGQRIKSVKELADVLEIVSDDVFNHHVTFDRNDFSNWINDVFKDEDLAVDLAGVKDKKDTRIIIYKYIIKCLDK